MQGALSLAALGFGLGLVGGVHCVAMCQLPIASLAHLATRGSPRALNHSAIPQPIVLRHARDSYATLCFQLGRVIGYSALGAGVGGLGHMLGWAATPWLGNGTHIVWATIVTWACVEWVCAAIGVRGVAPRLGLGRPMAWLYRAGLRRLRELGALHPPDARSLALLRGVVWALLPCGLIYAALPLALAAGDAAGGALTLGAFAVGTMPWHVAAPAVARLTHGAISARARSAGAIAFAAGTCMLVWQPAWLQVWLPPGLALCYVPARGLF
jgi:uncharacterized protein